MTTTPKKIFRIEKTRCRFLKSVLKTNPQIKEIYIEYVEVDPYYENMSWDDIENNITHISIEEMDIMATGILKFIQHVSRTIQYLRVNSAFIMEYFKYAFARQTWPALRIVDNPKCFPTHFNNIKYAKLPRLIKFTHSKHPLGMNYNPKLYAIIYVNRMRLKCVVTLFLCLKPILTKDVAKMISELLFY